MGAPAVQSRGAGAACLRLFECFCFSLGWDSWIPSDDFGGTLAFVYSVQLLGWVMVGVEMVYKAGLWKEIETVAVVVGRWVRTD